MISFPASRRPARPGPTRSAGAPARARGSLLIFAMIISAVIGISLVSYIHLGRTSLTISNRSLYNNAAMNLAENGMEEAMYSINRQIADATYSWSGDGWNVNTGTNVARRKWTGTEFDQNASGQVLVRVLNYDGTGSPYILARAIVTLGGGALAGRQIEKWVAVQLRRTSKFANGLVAKQTIKFNGGVAEVDSWNSDPDNDGLAPIAYDPGIRKDNGSVGSISVSVDSVAVQNASVFGFAATGGALPTVGSNGLVGTFTTPPGTMDMTRVSTDFSANFDPVAQPTGGSWVTSVLGAGPLGTAGVTAIYGADRIDINGGELEVRGKVTLYLAQPAGANKPAIGIGGTGSIKILAGASLIVYTAGDVKIAGNGIVNGGNTTATANQPISFQVWGTSTLASTKQEITITGNGALAGIVYAPNGTVSISGGAEVMGSVVANDITIVGDTKFHYDESLGNFGGGNPFRVTRWDELTAANARALWAAEMEGW